jgi:hypothetical protein
MKITKEQVLKPEKNILQPKVVSSQEFIETTHNLLDECDDIGVEMGLQEAENPLGLGQYNEKSTWMSDENSIEEVEKLLKKAAELAKDLAPELKQKLSQNFEEAINDTNEEQLPLPDLSGTTYTLYKPHTNAFEHLEREWSKWINFFNPVVEKNQLTSSYLKELDLKLYKALKNSVYYSKKRNEELIIKGEVIDSINKILPKKLSNHPFAVAARQYRSLE